MTDPLGTMRDQLVAGVADEPRRRRRRLAWRGVAAAALVALGALGVGLLRDDGRRPVVAGEPDGGVVDDRAPDDGALGDGPAEPSVWTIEQPPGWDRAGPELMPNLASPSPELTVATFELRPGGPNCAQVPEQALRDMGPSDVLVSVFSNGSATPDTPPLDDFSPATAPVAEEHDAAVCAERDDLRIRWGLFERAGAGLYVLVVFGSDTAPDVEATAWELVSSLRPLGTIDPTDAPTCIVTAPGSTPEGLAPATVTRTPPAGQEWYGTPDLWTALPIDGRHVRRKSVWWSQFYEGGAAEPEPDIAVTWKRLDRNRPTISAGPPGTNGSTLEQGWFMLAGIDPDEPGCWEVTATYLGGNELSYVYWNPERIEGAGEEAGTAEDRVLIDAFLRFADDPTAQRASQIPFAAQVDLGLGDRLHVSRDAAELVDPAAWLIEEPLFRAYSGPFSALTTAAGAGATTVRVGPHRHCAAPSVPAPAEVADLRRVSVQPEQVPGDSCLDWWTVDLFVDDAGEVAAVTMDLWEP